MNLSAYIAAALGFVALCCAWRVSVLTDDNANLRLEVSRLTRMAGELRDAAHAAKEAGESQMKAMGGVIARSSDLLNIMCYDNLGGVGGLARETPLETPAPSKALTETQDAAMAAYWGGVFAPLGVRGGDAAVR